MIYKPYVYPEYSAAIQNIDCISNQLGCVDQLYSPVKEPMALPVGSYHVPFLGYPIFILGIYNHKLGTLKKEYGMSLQVLFMILTVAHSGTFPGAPNSPKSWSYLYTLSPRRENSAYPWSPRIWAQHATSPPQEAPGRSACGEASASAAAVAAPADSQSSRPLMKACHVGKRFCYLCIYVYMYIHSCMYKYGLYEGLSGCTCSCETSLWGCSAAYKSLDHGSCGGASVVVHRSHCCLEVP